MYQVKIKDKQFNVEIQDIQSGIAFRRIPDGFREVVIESEIESESKVISMPKPVHHSVSSVSSGSSQAAPKPKPVSSDSSAYPVNAPIPGLVLSIPVKPGDMVKVNQVIIVIDAMKMENQIVSPVNGQVKEILVQKGAQVNTGDVLMFLSR